MKKLRQKNGQRGVAWYVIDILEEEYAPKDMISKIEYEAELANLKTREMTTRNI